jgi:CheY-like chemotaxis protein
MADTRGTILIVDDDPAAIELLSDSLGGKQLTVARAQNLDEHMMRARRSVRLSWRVGAHDRSSRPERIS